jgi:hypothetical protein
MTTETNVAAPAAPTSACETVRIRVHHGVMRKLGHWTTSRRMDVRASRASIMLDLRSPRIEAGDIEIHLDIDHAMVKVLVPDGAVIDHDEVSRVGRGRVKDWTGVSAPGGRRILLFGEMRHAEVRVHRGGIAILSAMCSREYLTDALQARREGRYPTIDDPSR